MPDLWFHGERDQLERIADALECICQYLHDQQPSAGPTYSTITITGDPMLQATQNFTDANGLATSAPAGNVEAWASDNTAVATVDSASGAVTEVADGTANISVANSGAFLPDGVTPFPDPAAFAFTVVGGAAVASTVTVA
jgi:hypothetical protein